MNQTMDEQTREVKIHNLIHRIGESWTSGAKHFMNMWPQENADCIQEAVDRLKQRHKWMNDFRATLRDYAAKNPDLFRQVLREFVQEL